MPAPPKSDDLPRVFGRYFSIEGFASFTFKPASPSIYFESASFGPVLVGAAEGPLVTLGYSPASGWSWPRVRWVSYPYLVRATYRDEIPSDGDRFVAHNALTIAPFGDRAIVCEAFVERVFPNELQIRLLSWNEKTTSGSSW